MEQVVIVGGGPVGIMLGCELRLAGIDPLVLERLDAPTGESRAGGLHPRSLEILAMRGMIEPFLAEGRRVPGAHYAGLPLPMAGLDTDYPFLLNLVQHRVEAHLADRAAALGLRVRRSAAVTGLRQLRRGASPAAPASAEPCSTASPSAEPSSITSPSAVPSFITSPSAVPFSAASPAAEPLSAALTSARSAAAVFARAGASPVVSGSAGSLPDVVEVMTAEGAIEAEYVVGCDGGRSAVRKLAGIDFPGTPATLSAMIADVRLDEPPADLVFQKRCPGGNYSVLVFEPGWYRVTTQQFGVLVDRETPVTVEDLHAALRELAGTDFGLRDPRWISRFGDAARLAADYRSGRVLLAGDAAHIHYPAGGQGLNTGLQDAVNLGWKLAAVLHGQDQSLLDSYATERRPVAARVLRNTRAQTALTRPDEQTSDLRSVMADIFTNSEVTTALAAEITALDVTYPLGEGAGHRAPNLPLADGTTLWSHLRNPHSVLLVPDAATPVPAGEGDAGGVDAGAVSRAKIAGAVAVVAYSGAGMLVRPDGHVAWVAAMGEAALRDALERWCGVSFNV